MCSCPTGLKFDKDNISCIDFNECELPWSCSQTCINTEKSYHCNCVDGYTRLPDGRSCKANDGNYV